MNFRLRIDPRLATVLAISLAFAAAASIVFVQVLGFTSTRFNLAHVIFAVPILGMAAVGALTWWVAFPRWLETKRVQKVVREVTGAGRAELILDRDRTWRNSSGLRLGWFGGMAAGVLVVFLLRAGSASAPLWTPLAMVTVLAQINLRQTIEERVRALAVCGLLLFVFGGLGRNLLTTLEGSVILVVSLFGLIGWHFWQERRGLEEMQTLVREARYDQAIAKAEASPSSFAPALKAYALFRQGDTENAKFELRVALAKAVDSSKAAFALAKYGELLLAEGQMEGAIAPVDGALQLRPEETRAHRVMAQIYLEQIDNVRLGHMRRESDITQQIKLLTRAHGRASRDGRAALSTSALHHAEQAVQKPHGKMTGYGAELAVLAWAQAAAGKQDEAQQTAERASTAIINQLDLAEGRYFLGRAYSVMGQTEQSRSCLEAVKGAEAKGHYRNLAQTALANLSTASPETGSPEIGSPEIGSNDGRDQDADASSLTALDSINAMATPVQSVDAPTP